MLPRPFTVVRGKIPVIAAAIHDGHVVRPEIGSLLALDDATRLREEDPHTSRWTALSDTRVVVHRSRFEVDMNRPRGQAVYVTPEQAWNLTVYREPLPPDVRLRSLAVYDSFYAAVEDLCEELVQRHGGFVLFDLHSYNHRRTGPDALPADPTTHPEINVGTGSMDHSRWAPIVDRFMSELRGQKVLDHELDVRENVKFLGGNFPRWVHQRFPRTGCAIAIEVKKTFMDEWTANVDEHRLAALGIALAATVPGVLEELCKLTKPRHLRSA